MGGGSQFAIGACEFVPGSLSARGVSMTYRAHYLLFDIEESWLGVQNLLHQNSVHAHGFGWIWENGTSN
jgi:hypothetical protein